jgi:hypothetical protein
MMSADRPILALSSGRQYNGSDIAMAREKAAKDPTPTLSLQVFWDWLVQHPNCILRAGTQDATLFDDEDLHWHLANEGPETLLVQVIRGKELLGELRLSTELVTYVQGMPSDQEGEFFFEMVSETASDRQIVYFFVLSHGFDTQEPQPRSRVH